MEAPGLSLPGKSARSNTSEITTKEREPWPSQLLYSYLLAIRAKSYAPDCRTHRSNMRMRCSPRTKCCRDYTTAEFSNCCADCLDPATKCWRPPSMLRGRPNQC